MPTERMRISTGVSELDPLLGGLLIGDNVVVYDDAGSLAAVYSMNFLQAALAQGKSFIYVSFDRSPRNLLDKLGTLAESENLTILDCFTFGKGKGADIFLQFYAGSSDQCPCRIIQVSEPHDPDQVMDCFLEAHATMADDVRFVFESLTGMQELWAGEDQISRFYTHTCPRLYELNTVGYWIMEKEAHSRRLKAAINQIAQVVIELSLRRGKTSLSILKAENREIETINTPLPYWTSGLSISFSKEKGATGHLDLGRRIRELRTKRGLSQTELARLVGVTPSNISQVESCQIYPSLPALIKMGEILAVEMNAFFHETGNLQRRPVFSESESVTVSLPGMPKESITAYLLTPLESHLEVEAYLIELHPETSLPSHFFIHKGEEIGYVLSGRPQMKIGAETYTLRTGDLIHLDKEIPVQWTNTGTASARMLWLKIR